MNEHTLRVLEYHKVTNIVAGYAASETGKAAVKAILPATDAVIVETRLRETGEFTRLLLSGESPPLDGILDIGPAIQKLGVAGSMLSPAELLNTALTLGVGRRVKYFFQRFEEKGALSRFSSPHLCAKAANIQLLKHIEDAVASAIDERAEVKDSASPELRKIRKQITRTREDILSRMSGILQDSGFQKIIQEPVITVRDDRYVLPLKPNFRQSLKGVVHGQSGSRSTLFVEPLEVLEQNNRLAELRMDEQEEVERILRELTALMAQQASAIAATIDALTELDAIYARARFGIEFNGIVPAISAEGRIRLRAARHPLLVGKYKSAPDGKSVMPNDIELGAHERALILSGPNAGGKTVVLKIMGLFALMAQSGLPVTSAEGSELPCFNSIFADIGDEQSLEQDLSTFSSHVSQIAEIFRQAKKGSLVLLDELGAGTDPGEGAALGAAVLEGLIERGAVTLVTTHHNALKLFGSQTNGAVNAAMEFDLQTLKPTYRLIAGRPGRSYGLDMATRLGVPDEVVQKARGRLSADDTRLEDLLKQVENDSRLLMSEREALKRDLSAVQHDRNEASTLLRAAQDEARQVKSKAKQESREVMAALRQKLREFSRVALHDRTEIKKAASDVETLVAKLAPTAPEQQTVAEQVHEYRVGDRVRILSVNKIGTVLASQRGMIEIELGNKTIKLSAKEVALVGPVLHVQKTHSALGWGAELLENEGAPDRLNILGLRVDEGLAEVDRFLDHASMRGLSIVTIIHGLGTGALKKAVLEFLKNHPLIAFIRPGEAVEGGAGVTVAELKK
jgi:DNA mismatch repair protein MutS2